ncbi:hypothetical protein GQX73_g3529 [Xylaria multiplex]|uniref:F-box domain-containing protein n=1 Tax=Xylaria multiplex TaxID=323545 RepID=A0A7C8N9M3_9PEZI|nr:hypothetical protein GQX73_g3529 [Xylaria multiplex]
MPRPKKSATSEEAALTPAQERRQAREEAICETRKRRARYGETPALVGENISIFSKGLFTRQRPANPAYDYRAKKRKVSDRKKPARRPHWEKKSKSKQPSPPPVSLAVISPVDTPPADQSPVSAVCHFMNIPPEIRDEILRYLLLWPHEIIVFRGWSRVYPRSRPRLDLSILCTCMALRDQGLLILFGENTFTYDLRDPAAAHDHTNPVLEKVFGDSVVPIDEYGHLIRHAQVKVHRSRIGFREHRQNFERAILRFLPGSGLAHDANLHTLTLEVPAENYEDLNWVSDGKKPDDVPICKYLRNDTRVGNALFKLKVQWIRILAWDRYGDCWETGVDMRYFAKDQQMKLEHKALKRDNTNSTVDTTGDRCAAGDTSATTCYRMNDIGAMEKAWDRGVDDAVNGLRGLAWRVECLVREPDRARQLGLWRPATTHKIRGLESNYEDELVSLPSDWSEPSFPTNMRSRRSRTASSHPSSYINPSTKVRNESVAKSKPRSGAKAKTRGKASSDGLNVFNAGDAARESRLLEAQHGIQENEAESDRGGMLTEEWLENMLEDESEDIRTLGLGLIALHNTVGAEKH